MKQREKLWTQGGYLLDGSTVYVLHDTIWLGKPHKENRIYSGVQGSKCSEVEKRATARLFSAASDLVEEHEEWASLLGEVYVLLEQEDYDTAMRLLNQNVTINFKAHDGAPAALSPALDKAYGDSQ